MPMNLPRLIGRAGYQALRLMPAEAAHDLGKLGMRRGLLGRSAVPRWPVTLFGRELPNPVGLAAGFDKNAELLGVFRAYGFGFMEIGSVTLRGGTGNPKPRMFRMEYPDIMNRMGLNGDPAAAVARRLLAKPQAAAACGINIAKTHDAAIVGDAAVEDVLGSYRLLKQIGLYTVLNVSCPNTREGKTFEEPAALAELLAAVHAERGTRPLCVKLSPMEDRDRLSAVVAVCEDSGIDGYVAVNTKPAENQHGRGGLSGTAVQQIARDVVRFVKRETGKPVIGCGGVFTPHDAAALLDAGANAVQAYNGFVRGPHAGPAFARDIVQHLGNS